MRIVRILENIIKFIIMIGVVVFMILAVKKNDWTQGIFWLLTLICLTTNITKSIK